MDLFAIFHDANNLILAVFGAIVWPALQFAFGIVSWFWRKVRGSVLWGNWHHYYFNWDTMQDGNSPTFKHEIWSIRPGIFKQFIVSSAMADDVKGPKFKGHVSKQGHHLVFQLNAVGHDETVVEIFPAIVQGENIMRVGVAVAQDWQNHAACGGAILSNSELKEEKVRELMKSRLQVAASKFIMRLK